MGWAVNAAEGRGERNGGHLGKQCLGHFHHHDGFRYVATGPNAGGAAFAGRREMGVMQHNVNSISSDKKPMLRIRNEKVAWISHLSCAEARFMQLLHSNVHCSKNSETDAKNLTGKV